MILGKEEIENFDKVYRLNVINSVTGIKPANLIATQSLDGVSNVAIFSSIVHLGSNPALIAFILRPHTEVKRDTYNNILRKGQYTINHVHESIYQKAHYTSAKIEESEFERCKLTEEYIDDTPVPFVQESKIKLLMDYKQSIPIELNGTVMVIGEVNKIIIDDEIVLPDGRMDLDRAGSVGVSGLDAYYSLNRLGSFEYARPTNIPDFNEK